MSASAAAEIAEYEYQLDQILGALETDPENDELLTLKNELHDLIKLTKGRLTVGPSAASTHVQTRPAETDKKRKHESSDARKVGDQVLAKWITGDHQFYVAKITSITGNQTDPVYTVKFVDYNEIQTLHGHQLRSINEHKSRVVDHTTKSRANTFTPPPPAASGTKSIPPPPPSNTDTSSTTQPKKKVSTLKDDLKQSATSWNSFAKSGPKTTKKVGKRKAIGEGSMFRTEDGGRVGVIGSGRAMTSDPGKRGRHVFETDR